jgi:hypothetical protein
VNVPLSAFSKILTCSHYTRNVSHCFQETWPCCLDSETMPFLLLIKYQNSIRLNIWLFMSRISNFHTFFLTVKFTENNFWYFLIKRVLLYKSICKFQYFSWIIKLDCFNKLFLSQMNAWIWINLVFHIK